MKTLLAILLLASLTEAKAVLFSDVVGTHYATSSWSNNVRKPTNVDATINSSDSYETNLTAFTATAGNLSAYNNVVLQVFGGREYSNVEPFLAAIDADAGEGLRRHMKSKAAKTKGMKNVYWQVGNEINNGALFSPSIHTYLKDGLPGADNDLTIIPAYAEYWGAAVAGLLAGDPEAQIILGSVANASSAGAMDFINTLLNYTFVGTYAPTLKGKKVSDVFKIGSIHYSQTTGGWEKPIAAFTSRGMKVIHTEEVGLRAAEDGLGMVKGIKAIGRTLSETNGRVFLWGTNIGPHNIDQWMPILAWAMSEDLTPTAAFATGQKIDALYFGMPNGKRVAFINSGVLQSVSGTGWVLTFSASGPLFIPASNNLNLTIDGSNAVFLMMD